MKRLASLLFVIVVFAPAFLCAQLKSSATAPMTPEDRTRALHALFHDYWEENLKRQPEFASSIGDKRYNDKISDYSVKAVNDWLAREQNFLMRLAAIDPAGLHRPGKDQPRSAAARVHRRPGGGRIQGVGDAGEPDGRHLHRPIRNSSPQLSFTTVKDYDDWIARLHPIPNAFDQVTTNMSIGIEDQRVPPKYLLEKSLDQVKQLADQKPEDSPLAAAAEELSRVHLQPPSRSASRPRCSTRSPKRCCPPICALRASLRSATFPPAATEPGISALPDGAKYYQFLIRRTTTTDLTADQIHQIGLDEVKKDEAEMLAIAQKLGFTGSGRASAPASRPIPSSSPASADALLDAYRGYLGAHAGQAARSSSAACPKRRLKWSPFPTTLRRPRAPAYYEHGTPDGSRPGRLCINTYNATDRNLYAVEAIAYHEGIPGHHLQISIAQELDGHSRLPQIRAATPPSSKAGRSTPSAWARTSASTRIPTPTTAASKPTSGAPSAWSSTPASTRSTGPATRWSHYFHDHSAIDETSVQSEVDRYIAWPSQALAYKIGQLKILELRDRAKKALGDKFDIRAFHDQVLDSGALPLDVLDERIDAWIATQKAAGK